MRSCVVEKCVNTDSIILCHRFPKNRNIAKKWQTNLNLQAYQLDTLISKYVVCCQHFEDSDYRNPASNCLNSTALPTLNPIRPRPSSSMCTKYSTTELRLGANDPEDQGSSSPLNESDSIELLNRDDCEISTDSSPSNLRYKDRRQTDALTQSMDGTDFTLLDANGCTMYTPFEPRSKSADAVDVETVSFILESQDSSENSNDFRPRSTDDGFPPCSTDSDVEVLESEAIYESENPQLGCNISVIQSKHNQKCSSPETSEGSDKDNNIANHMRLWDVEYEHLDRYQLIDIIRNQSTQIEDLQEKLNKYKVAHDNFFTHFEAFRSSVCDSVIM